jgi:hypothetical protein
MSLQETAPDSVGSRSEWFVDCSMTEQIRRIFSAFRPTEVSGSSRRSEAIVAGGADRELRT